MENVPGESTGPESGDVASGPVLDSIDLSVLEDKSQVLLLGPMRGSLDDHACTSLMGAWPVTNRNVLFVSLTQPAEDRFELLRTGMAGQPERACVVSGADRYPSQTTTDADHGQTTFSVEVIGDPSDLPRLGMTINKVVDGWAEGGPPLLCFHSLTALLQYAGSKRVFRFVHLLQNRLHGSAHYHMDSDAHDRQTVATLRPLFDAIVEYDADGNVTITD